MIRRAVILSFAAFAFCGLAISVAVHVSTFFGVDPMERFPFLWAMHPGIFFVFIPAILAMHVVVKERPDSPLEPSTIRGLVPRSLGFLTCTLFAYAFFNFFFSLLYLNGGGSPGIIDGQKVLHSHGHVARTLTDDEYRLHSAYVARAFSGHWMLFYCASAAMLIAAATSLRDKRSKSERKPDGLASVERATGVRRVPSSPSDE